MTELGIESNDLDGKKLFELRSILSEHKAFSEYDSKLEKKAADYNVTIKWIHKFHCELNPIEGLWCYLKQYVRKRNDQDYKKFKDLVLNEIIEAFQKKGLNIKLWERFWKTIEMYGDNKSYEDVLQTLFGA
jgi:hypothetical protein